MWFLSPITRPFNEDQERACGTRSDTRGSSFTRGVTAAACEERYPKSECVIARPASPGGSADGNVMLLFSPSASSTILGTQVCSRTSSSANKSFYRKNAPVPQWTNSSRAKKITLLWLSSSVNSLLFFFESVTIAMITNRCDFDFSRGKKMLEIFSLKDVRSFCCLWYKRSVNNRSTISPSSFSQLLDC